MKTFSRFLVITTLVAALAGCLGGAAPDFGQRDQALTKVDGSSLPTDLMSCDDFYGEDWDIPDSILIVVGRTGLVVLVQADEMVCSGYTSQLETRLQHVDIGRMLPIDGEGDVPGGGGENGLGDEVTDSPVGDSNPLPAIPPVDDESETVEDSNPLPAVPPVDDESETVEDSNPLPAHDDDSAVATYTLTSVQSNL
jgi:hypothetical protein